MSISSTTNRNSYTGNGSSSSYSYTYRIFQNSDLLVTVKDTSLVETTLTLTTDYTVSGVGDLSGGSISLVNSAQSWLTAGGNLKSGYVIVIRRVLDLVQETDIRNQGEFYPEIHEDQFDKGIMIAQQQQDSIDKSIRLPETILASDFNPILPTSIADVDNAGATVIINPTGDGFDLGPTVVSIAAHNADTTSVHGIADTSLLATQSDISTHNSDTTSVHGIADTSVLATQSDISTHAAVSTSVHGVTGSVVGTSGTQTLTNKKYDGGTASANNVFVISKDTKANLDALTRIAGAIYYATDDDLFYKDNGTTLVALTAANAKVFAMAEFSTNVAVSGRLNFDNVLSDALSTITTGASWVFTAPRNDTYRVNVNYQGNAGAAMQIYANGSLYRGISDVVVGLSVSSTVEVPLLSGQTLYIFEASSGYTSQGAGNVNWIQIVA